jgi:WD40 repeat protein
MRWNPGQRILRGFFFFVMVILCCASCTTGSVSRQSDFVLQDPIEPLPPHAIARIGSSRLREQALITSVDISPNGNYLASATIDGNVRLWAVPTGKLIRNWVAQRDGVTALAFSPTGHVLVTGGPRGEICGWRLSGERDFGLKVGNRTVLALSYSATGQMLAAGTQDGHLAIWSSGGLQDPIVSKSMGESVLALTFSNDDRKIAIATSAGKIKQYDARTGEELSSTGIVTGARHITFTGTDHYLVYGGKDGELSIWATSEMNSPRELRSRAQRTSSVTAFPNTDLIAWGIGGEAQVRVVDARDGKEVTRFGQHVGGVHLIRSAARSNLIVTVDGANTLHLWDRRSWNEVGGVERHDAPITAVRFIPDGSRIVTGDQFGVIRVWDQAGKPIGTLQNQQNEITALSADPTGKKLLAGSIDSTATLWDLEHLKKLGSVNLGTSIRSMQFTPDGNRCAIMDGKGDIHFFTADLTSALRVISTSVDEATFALSDDTARVFTAGKEARLQIWNAETGALEGTIAGTEGQMTSLEIIAPGEQVISLSGEYGAIVWDLKTRRSSFHLPLQTKAISISRDGYFIASADDGGVITLWEVLTAREILYRKGHEGKVTHLVFHPSSDRLLSIGADKVGLLWNFEPDKTLEQMTGKQSSSDLWESLMVQDPGIAFPAMFALMTADSGSISFLKDALEVPASRLAELISDLDNDEFVVRDRATYELAKIGAPALPALRKALESSSPEVRTRAEHLLHLISGPAKQSPGTLRRLRVIWVLEHIGSQEAESILMRIGESSHSERERNAAKGALIRLRGP